ncbi:MAG: hypothetical protein H0T42_19790 [Deltaproteobacteria bacterium]|nr:hypothetical protein [Deltaproteobacteria bacterium]
MATQAEDELVAQAFSADKHEDLARAIEKLSPEEAEFFVQKLEAALRKRKIQLYGYLAAAFLGLATMLGGLVYVGTHEGFTGWVFLLPFAMIGLVLWVFGKWADRAGAKAVPGLPPKPSPKP